jgi:hypothetical protein
LAAQSKPLCSHAKATFRIDRNDGC